MRIKISRSWDSDITKYSDVLNKYELSTVRVDEYCTYHEIEIESLEDLIVLRKEIEQEIILDVDKEDCVSLEIYDTWRE